MAAQTYAKIPGVPHYLGHCGCRRDLIGVHGHSSGWLLCDRHRKRHRVQPASAVQNLMTKWEGERQWQIKWVFVSKAAEPQAVMNQSISFFFLSSFTVLCADWSAQVTPSIREAAAKWRLLSKVIWMELWQGQMDKSLALHNKSKRHLDTQWKQQLRPQQSYAVFLHFFVFSALAGW